MNKHGFTLLEVTLFLAVASFLGVVAIIGLAPRLRNVRFSGAVRDLENNLTAQFTNQASGQNDRPNIASCSVSGTSIVINSAGTTGAGQAVTCVANGIVAVLDKDSPDQITYRQIVSSRLPSAGCQKTGFDNVIDCHKATVLGVTGTPANSTTIYRYINGLRQTPPLSESLAVGYVQDPNGTSKYQFSLSSPDASIPSGALQSLSPSSSQTTNFQVCYGLGDRQARFTFNNRSLKPEVAINQGCSV